MTNKELAKCIIEIAGEKSNISKVTNCMTRLRLTVNDSSVVDTGEIKSLDDVLGLIVDGDSFQIVLGPGKARKVADCFSEKLNDGESKDYVAGNGWKENKDTFKVKQKDNSFKRGIRTVTEIFIPLIPAIIAAGLFTGFASLITTLQIQGILGNGGLWNSVRLMFSLLGGAFLSYFAIYTGINSAKQFGATEAMGGMIGAISIGPNIVDLSSMLGLYNEDVPLKSILTTGKGGIIGVIVGVWILAKVERAIRKRIPDVLDLIVTPFTSLLITGAIFVFIVMPVAGFLSDGLVAALNITINSTNPVVSAITGYILSALYLPMVLFGLHHGLMPIYAVQLEQMGGISLFPVLIMAGAGQVGAAIAIYMIANRVGNVRLKKVITGALPAGFLGIGEPLIYGVTLPMSKPFVTAGIGAGFGGAYIMLTHVMSNSWGPSGLTAVPIMKPECILNFLIGMIISYIGGFIVTKLAIRDKDVEGL